MNTLDIRVHRPSARADFVSTDAADLACHIHHCATARGRLFGLHSALQSLHALASPRIVTVAVLAGSMGMMAMAFA